MPKVVSPGGGTIEVPFGHPSVFSIYINNVEQTGIDYWKFVERVNYLSSFEAHIYGITSSDTDVANEKLIKFFSESNPLYVGKITKIDYGSYSDVFISGNKMGETNLMRKEIDTLSSATGTVKRQQYDAIDTNTMVTEICGSDITVGTNTNYGDLSMRFENVNKMKALSSIADAIDYEWKTTHGSYPFETSTFNIDTQIGSATSTYTFQVSGATQNVEARKTIDTDNLVNCCYVYGYGDGINQVKTSISAVSNVYTTLNENLAIDDTTITLTDASSFPSSGKIIIAEEVVAYTGKSTNNLTGCTRGSTDATATATTAKKHNKGCLVFEYYNGSTYYTKTSPKTGSSIQENTLMEKSIDDRTLIKDSDKISEPTAELIASRIILNQKDPIERIIIYPYNMVDVSNTVSLGDTVTVTDENAGLSGTYRMMGRTIGLTDEGFVYELELSNIRLSYLEEMRKLKEAQESQSLAAQGSTVTDNLSEKENLDASTTLDMLFYLPSDVIAINKALLSFKLKDFRAYSSGAASGGSSTPTTGGGSSHTHTVTTTNHTHITPTHNHNLAEITADWPTGGYPLSSNVGATTSGGGSGTSGSGGAETPTSSADTSHTHTVTIGNHTHTITYAIYTDTQSSKSVTVTAGKESSEIAVGVYSADQAGLDLATQIKDAYTTNGAGWYNVKFAGNKNMRIEANLFLKYFIESK